MACRQLESVVDFCSRCIDRMFTLRRRIVRWMTWRSVDHSWCLCVHRHTMSRSTAETSSLDAAAGHTFIFQGCKCLLRHCELGTTANQSSSDCRGLPRPGPTHQVGLSRRIGF